jgi:hypothetical protein
VEAALAVFHGRTPAWRTRSRLSPAAWCVVHLGQVLGQVSVHRVVLEIFGPPVLGRVGRGLVPALICGASQSAPHDRFLI